MKNRLLIIIAAFVSLLFNSGINYAQVINLGTAADFVLFTTNGAVTNVGTTHLTGHVGTNVGGSTGFGNVDGVMHDQDPGSAQATLDLNVAYLELDAAISTNSPGVLLGSGMTLVAGVHNIPAAATMNGELNLDAQNDPNAVFIIQIEGAFGIGANAEVKLLNDAQACNVYWKVDGAVSMAPGVIMKGTIVAYNDFISMSAGDSLEGRALSINGAVGVSGIVARTPLGCLAPILTGPANPDLLTTECFVLFSAIGPVTNVGITTVTGDVGTNSESPLGFDPLLVTGTIHPVPDAFTAQCAADVTTVYNDLSAIPYDIELLYPALFGNNLVLTPHVYLMNSAVTFTDTLFLNAQGNPDAVFVFQVYGAFSSGTYSNIVLQNGAQAKNVYWVMNGAIEVGDYSIFNGSIISQGAVDLLTGVTFYGRVLTAVGAVSTFAIDAIMPTSCAPIFTAEPNDTLVCDGESASFTIISDGVGLTYQWRRGNVDLINGGNISGATTATLTINPATILDEATDYNVIVTGSFAPADTSVFVSLTIDTAPVITMEPSDTTVCLGESASFTVVASGLGNTYQWRRGIVDLIDGASISGATTATLIIDPTTLADAANDYNVLITGTCLPDAISVDVSLIVDEAPLITMQPNDTTVCLGESAGFTIVASGVGNTYQWRRGIVDLVDGGAISGATTATLIIDPTTVLDAGNDYNVVVSGACLPDVISNDVALTVEEAPGITTQPMDETVCLGDAASFTVVASGGAGITYQWRKGIVDLVDGGAISGATTATLIIDPTILLDAASDYNVVVSGLCLPDVISDDVALVVNVCLPDVSVVKTASSMTPIIGEDVVFTITANNLGLTDVTGVEVEDILQNGYTYVSSNATIGTYDEMTGVWIIGNLNAGDSETLTIVATVNQTGDYENTAEITINEVELDITNNVSTILPIPSDFFIPEGFSPNGDMVNDVFFIRGILAFPSNEFTVFNRWGNIVFSAQPYQNTWDGKSGSDFNVGGDVLPVGTYFYVLNLGDASEIYKGTIYLNN